MSASELIFLLAAIVTVLASVGGLSWWSYKRGRAAGKEQADRDAARAEDQARIEALERQLDETKAELVSLQQRRRRIY